MKKSIEELKAIITDGMKLISKTSSPIIIHRFPNNIIKIYNKSVSWKHLLDLLVNGEYELEIENSQLDLFKKKWGGFRFPGPGKKLGRNKVKDKKVPVTISIKESVKKKMIEILENENTDKNQFFENFINTTYEKSMRNEL